MKSVLIRIAALTSAGFLVSFGWGFYFATANKDIPIGPIGYILARLTQPTAAVVLYLNPDSPLGLTWVAVTNAATYALLGLMVEMVRRHHQSLPPRGLSI
jgi:hypothetical protein